MRASGVLRREPLRLGRAMAHRMAGDGGVRVLVDLRVDRPERLRHRVGQDVGAGDHRYPEHDGKRRQNGTQFAREEASEGEADHVRASSSMVLITVL